MSKRHAAHIKLVTIALSVRPRFLSSSARDQCRDSFRSVTPHATARPPQWNDQWKHAFCQLPQTRCKGSASPLFDHRSSSRQNQPNTRCRVRSAPPKAARETSSRPPFAGWEPSLHQPYEYEDSSSSQLGHPRSLPSRTAYAGYSDYSGVKNQSRVPWGTRHSRPKSASHAAGHQDTDTQLAWSLWGARSRVGRFPSPPKCPQRSARRTSGPLRAQTQSCVCMVKSPTEFPPRSH